MKLWIGTEKEFTEPTQTLFVCESELTKNRLQIINAIADELEVNRIYFGGGRRNVRFFDESFKNINKEVVVEICVNENPIFPEVLPKNISFVYSIRDNILSQRYISNSTLKIDNYKDAIMYEKKRQVDIQELQNDRYSDDVEIYNDDEEIEP